MSPNASTGKSGGIVDVVVVVVVVIDDELSFSPIRFATVSVVVEVAARSSRYCGRT